MAEHHTTARTVIHSNGRAYRVAFKQPLGFRRGTDPLPAIDPVARAANTALRSSKSEVLERSMRRNPH